MYLISDGTKRYVKVSANNKISFTSNETLAETFNSKREVTDFIRKNFPKKKRKTYKAVNYDGNSLITHLNNESAIVYGMIDDDQHDSIISMGSFDDVPTNIKKIVDIYLLPNIEKYNAQLKKYDGMILDIRHYIRDSNTKANACWGYMIFQSLQKLERKRADCKMELQRYDTLRTSILKAVKEFKKFQYDEYKNRQINNVVDFINNVDNQLENIS